MRRILAALLDHAFDLMPSLLLLAVASTMTGPLVVDY